MDKKIILLPGMKFMSGGVLYKPGDILPDTEDARALVQKKKAALYDDTLDEDVPSVRETDGYERQRVKDLSDLAKGREISIPSGANKAQIIELLRAWDVENGNDDEDEGDA